MAPSSSPGRDRRARAGRHERWRRGLARAVAVALAIHATVLLSLRLPAERGRPTSGPLLLVPRPAEVLRPTPERRLAGPDAVAEAGASAPPVPSERAGPSIPTIRESRAARTETTIPATTLIELRGATLPLVATGTGVGRRRLERTEAQIATARAESLLYARMAGLVVPVREVGAIGLANGGITVAIPWQGFLPADRRDEAWRAERCAGGDDGEADKAGEAEARSAQCG